MPLTPHDLQTFENYKKAMKTAASNIRGKDTPFCIYSEVQIPDTKGKLIIVKPFLVVGTPVNAVTPLLKNLHGSKTVACSGSCSIEGDKISFVSKSGTLNHGQIKPHVLNLLGKNILDPAHAGAGTKKAPEPAKLTQAAVHWHGARTIADAKIKDLKRAVTAHYAKASPGLLKQIDKSMSKIDAILDKLDHRLADSLKASAATNEAARQNELRKTKAILDEYKRIVQSEQMIAHIDKNPFKVNTNLKQTLLDSLKKAEESMS
jgi:hypothetical protein